MAGMPEMQEQFSAGAADHETSSGAVSYALCAPPHRGGPSHARMLRSKCCIVGFSASVAAAIPHIQEQ